MKTLDQIKDYPGGASCNMIDGRDKARLLDFLALEDWGKWGYALKDGAEHTPEPFTEENVKRHLAVDLAFAFQKCNDERGISTGLMFEVIKMWMWVLDDELSEGTEYSGYGRSFYNSVAEKYNLPKG